METYGSRTSLQSVDIEEWFSILHNEYLCSFIKEGGAAVRFVCADNGCLDRIASRIHELSAKEGYFHSHLDPGVLGPDGRKPDLHRIDRFYLAVTASVQWKDWARDQAREHLVSRGILTQGCRLDDVEGIAALNGRDAVDLQNQYHRELATTQIKDHQMVLEFGAALTFLLRAQLIPDCANPTTEEVVLEWLAGQTIPGGATALKKIQIYERINQSNARNLLLSFCNWLPRARQSGLVAVLDLRPYEHK